MAAPLDVCFILLLSETPVKENRNLETTFLGRAVSVFSIENSKEPWYDICK